MIDKIKKVINVDDIDLTNISVQKFLDILIKLNKSLRVLDESEEALSDNMQAGDLIAPTEEVRNAILEYLVNNMGKIENLRDRAAVVYYTLINLHMFSDGNGRTARFMYDLISGDLSDDNISYYFHSDSKQTKENNNNLEEIKGILDITDVNKFPDLILKAKLDFVPRELMENYNWITVGHSNSSPDTDKILPSDVVRNLSERELQNLDCILKDGYGMNLCPSGLAVLYVAQKKGQLEYWIDKNKSEQESEFSVPGRFNFSIYKNPDSIRDWNIEDFRELISVGNAIKFARLKSIIDIFVEPQKYIDLDSGNTYADIILGNETNQEKEIEHRRT